MDNDTKHQWENSNKALEKLTRAVEDSNAAQRKLTETIDGLGISFMFIFSLMFIAVMIVYTCHH